MPASGTLREHWTLLFSFFNFLFPALAGLAYSHLTHRVVIYTNKKWLKSPICMIDLIGVGNSYIHVLCSLSDESWYYYVLSNCSWPHQNRLEVDYTFVWQVYIKELLLPCIRFGNWLYITLLAVGHSSHILILLPVNLFLFSFLRVFFHRLSIPFWFTSTVRWVMKVTESN